ncbi:CoA pyrophosphatase [Sphingomonas sp. ID0503]|uniref:CoA pyrophosphatase n=1 Tax=Sphingomonas sp. ID0503 TaxID=3399691 RepID=UPI003AFAD27B
MTLTERLRASLDSPASSGVAGDDFVFAEEAVLTAAAVLVPIVDRPAPTVLLTRRTDTLRKHAGQIAFPGGRIDPEDSSPEAAALREAWEEIALDPADVTVVGRSDTYRTGTGYSVTPVIGIIPPDLSFIPNAGEVAEIFEVPFERLIDPAVHVAQTSEFGGRMRRFYEITIDGYRVWGATAGMIVNLAARLRNVPA